MTAASDFAVRYATAQREHERRSGKPKARRPKAPPAPKLKDYVASGLSALASAANPTQTGMAVGEQIANAVPRVFGGIGDYIMGNSPADVASDVWRGTKAVGSYLSDPMHAASTALDFIPGVGDVKGLGEDLHRAAQLRASGDVAGARDYERLAVPLAVAGIIPGIGEARTAGRLAEEGLDVARAVERSASDLAVPRPTVDVDALADIQRRARSKTTPNTAFGVELRRPGDEPISAQAARLGLPLDNPEMFYAQHEKGYHSYVPREIAEATDFSVSPTLDMGQHPVVSPEDIEGMFAIGTPGDRKNTGVAIERLGGGVLDEPVELHGGALYGLGQKARGLPFVWNNNEEAAGPMRGAIARILEAGGDPVGMFVAMGPHAVDQTQAMTRTVAGLLPSAEIAQKDRDAFNAMIREGYGSGRDPVAGLPDFPGIESPDFATFLSGLTMPVRANVIKAMDASARRKQGFPDIGGIRVASATPELLHVPSGSAGFSVMRFGPESLERHPEAPASAVTSYNDPTAGQNWGGFDFAAPVELTHPDFFAARRAANKEAGSDLRSFTLQPVVQEFTPKVVDALMRYREQIKRFRD